MKTTPNIRVDVEHGDTVEHVWFHNAEADSPLLAEIREQLRAKRTVYVGFGDVTFAGPAADVRRLLESALAELGRVEAAEFGPVEDRHHRDPDCRIARFTRDHRCVNRDGDFIRPGQSCWQAARSQLLHPDHEAAVEETRSQLVAQAERLRERTARR